MISGIITIIFVFVFIGIVWWAYSRSNKQAFEDAGRLPFEEDKDNAPTSKGDQK